MPQPYYKLGGVPEQYTLGSNNLDIGQIAVVLGAQGGAEDGEIVIQTIHQLVSLNDPSKTWSNDPDFRVRLLPPGTVLTLEIL